MHEHHDEALILDLLDAAATDAAAAARLDGCERCISDLAEQRSIAAHLSDLEPISLTGPERVALRSGVLSEIESGAEVVTLSPGRSWDWTRLGTVAAALAGIVVVAGLFSLLGGGGDDGGVQAATLESADDAGGSIASSAEAPMADEERATEALAEESADAAATIAAPSELVIDLGPIDRPTLAEELERVRNQVEDMTESSGVLQSDADAVAVSCLVELPDPGAVRAIVKALVDGFEVEVYLDDAGAEFGYSGIDCSSYELP